MLHLEDDSSLRSDHQHRFNRIIRGSVGALLAIGLLSACGDDSSPEAAYCEAGDDLEASVQALRDVDIVAEGVSGVEDRLGDVSDDLATLKERAADVASDDIDALDTAVSQLRASIDGLGDDVSAAGASEAIAAVGAVVDAANGVRETLATTCD